MQTIQRLLRETQEASEDAEPKPAEEEQTDDEKTEEETGE